MGKKKRQSDPHANSESTDSNDEKDGQKDCPHILRSVDNAKLRKNIKIVGLQIEKCSECDKIKSNEIPDDDDDDDEMLAMAIEAEDKEFVRSLWLCLRCGTQLCGRFRKKHAIQHYATPRSDSHAIVLNTTTFKLWCYDCDADIRIPRRKKLLYELVEFIKEERNKLEKKENLNCISSLLSDGKNVEETAAAADPSDLTQMQENESNKSEMNMIIPTIILPQQLPSNECTVVQQQQQQPQQKPLPRVRGLTNLGNTCFFNAVLQCLAQTPYLISVLNTASKPGEKFELPGGKLTLENGEEIDLPPIKSQLCAWYPLTEALHETLTELQQSGGTYNPRKLFNLLIKSRPQFSGGDQHDSHELLRHLLESVRTEDLKRYQKEILESLQYNNKNNKGAAVSDDMRKKCKFYGGQADKRILIPEQVFRGYLVSTLICQDCSHVSPSFESFLDISLPVIVGKSAPPATRRKISPEPNTSSTNSSNTTNMLQIKSQNNTSDDKNDATPKLSKKEQRKRKKLLRKKGTKQNDTTSTPNDDDTKITPENDGDSNSSSEQTDADVEDNLTDDKSNVCRMKKSCDANLTMEKNDDHPENDNKDRNGGDPNETIKEIQTEMLELTISEKGRATLLRQTTNNSVDDRDYTNDIDHHLNEDTIENAKKLRRRTRIRTYSYTNWSTKLASQYKCDENECSIQSCLNGFTALELMCGNNKVGCDQCTEIFHGKNGKTFNTNATKQFLLSSPPAVLILHLKRFQVGPRYMFRKFSKNVTFPLILDIAPICATNVKNLPNVKLHQKKLIYSLYGIVEHSGSMHGGHYTAFVKVRLPINSDDPRWMFIPKGSKAELDQCDEQVKRLESDLEKSRERERRAMANEDADDSDDSLFSSSSSSDYQQATNDDNIEPDDIKPLPGKWYYVSDSHVRESNEDEVQNAQAYLLFYERIY